MNNNKVNANCSENDKLFKEYYRIPEFIYSAKNDEIFQIESELELDLFSILEFDGNYKQYGRHLCDIKYYCNGNTHIHTPQYYIKVIEPNRKKSSIILCDLILREDLYNTWHILKPKLKATVAFCNSNGMKYKILTEKQIRNEYLDNIKFLWRYRNPKVELNSSDMQLLMSNIEKMRKTTITELMQCSTKDINKRGELLYHIWRFVSVGIFNCDLNKKLSMESIIWI